jgi:16S rRNA (adenine1518-N6/adenine1519-N6)-dimethyltransferase
MSELLLSTRAGVRAALDLHGLTAKKKLGQHFLVDGHVLQKIIRAADVRHGDTVLEIGPGIGSMTEALLHAGAEVIAIELDKTFVPFLRARFTENFSVVHGDVLKTDLHTLLVPHRGIKVIANLPYYITTPVVFKLLESGIDFAHITVMVQREVAARMAAVPGTKDYGSLSLAAQYYADVDLVANVPVNCFMPRPAVDSAVVRLTLLGTPRVPANKERLFDIIHAAFGKRRKTLLNALADAKCFAGLSKAELAGAIESAGINPQARGETLTLEDFARLSVDRGALPHAPQGDFIPLTPMI